MTAPPRPASASTSRRGGSTGGANGSSRSSSAGYPSSAVIVATHDPEFAAAVAERVILLAHGRVVADGPIAEILSDGAYFATETARILGGAGGALTPEQGVLRDSPGRRRCTAIAAAEAGDDLAARRLRDPAHRPGGGLCLV